MATPVLPYLPHLPLTCLLMLTGLAACDNGGVCNLAKPDVDLPDSGVPREGPALDAQPDAALPDSGVPREGPALDAKVDQSISPTIADLDYTRMIWAVDVDVGHLVRNEVYVLRSGSIQCTQSLNGEKVSAGVSQTPEPELVALLAQPGMIAKLVTPCLARWADAGPYIETSLAGSNTVVKRLVFKGCEDDALIALVTEMQKAGQTCIEQATPLQRG